MSCPSSSRRTAPASPPTGLPATGGPGPGPANRASAAASCHQVPPKPASRMGSHPLLTYTAPSRSPPSSDRHHLAGGWHAVHAAARGPSGDHGRRSLWLRHHHVV
eukprot:CAMPEP_0183456234 /NCGR_PEP_ID=MMETSP0370-20130417/128508_1 /TAXON_ID=268820 /ORGANISM="Peridinium aciculiferum, Strain PAER-2" /LENGTH=104 /DNA_ID=CAMNT_0025647863 /DNA_START=108 /DNA_END=419 /DNA_ORIENTATION=-